MSAGQAAGADPGLHAGELSEEELAEEESVRSETSVSDLVEQDLDDTATPSRSVKHYWRAGGESQPGSFDGERRADPRLLRQGQCMDRALQRVGGPGTRSITTTTRTSGTSSCPRRCLPPPRRRRRRPRSSPTSWPGSGTAWAFDSRRFPANPSARHELRRKPWCREHPDL